MKKTSSTVKKSVTASSSPPVTLSAVVAELQGLRRDMVVLCRVTVEGQKLQRRALQQQLKDLTRSDGGPQGFLSSNVLPPSFYDPIFEADQEMAGR